MADEATSSTSNNEAAVETSDDSVEATATEATTVQATDEGEKALGDAGKKALDAMKTKWKEAEAARKALESDFQAFKAKAEGKEAEFTAAQEAQRIKDEALSAANERILRAELRATAKGKLTDPTDVFRFPEIVDLSAFEVGANGEVDTAALEAAVTNLIETRPDLAAQGKRFQGGADAGARNGSTQPSQLTEADVKRLYAEKKYDQIEQAKQEGRLNDYLGIK